MPSRAHALLSSWVKPDIRVVLPKKKPLQKKSSTGAHSLQLTAVININHRDIASKACPILLHSSVRGGWMRNYSSPIFARHIMGGGADDTLVSHPYTLYLNVAA